ARSSRSNPIATPHVTAPVRRRGTRSAGSAARRRNHPTPPALATLVRSDNDGQATERGLVASSRTPLHLLRWRPVGNAAVPELVGEPGGLGDEVVPLGDADGA